MSVIDSIQISGVTYTIQGSGGGGNPTVELTQAQYDALVTAGTVSADTYYIITDAQAGDLTNYYTKTETNTLLGGKADTATTYTKTEVDNAITAATSTKQDTLVSGTNIKTINNESLLGSGNITIQGGGGGGKAIEAGRGISITTGETADTVSFNLPISAFSYSIYSDSNIGFFNNFNNLNGFQNITIVGNLNEAYCNSSFFHGNSNTSYGNGSFISGFGCRTNELRGFAFGEKLKTNNVDELSTGKYNNSVSVSTTFGDSGNTLFSVGNGTADNARHNAFEIRQNGDIYYFDGTNDVKLQDKFSSLDSTIGDINTILESI